MFQPPFVEKRQATRCFLGLYGTHFEGMISGWDICLNISQCHLPIRVNQLSLKVRGPAAANYLLIEINKAVIRTALLWATARRVVVIYYRRFGTTYRPHF
jgi:hypothetical protein